MPSFKAFFAEFSPSRHQDSNSVVAVWSTRPPGLGTAIETCAASAAASSRSIGSAHGCGASRNVHQWIGTNDYKDVPEWVESIPYTETRDYVQAILRNREMYRAIYGGN